MSLKFWIIVRRLCFSALLWPALILSPFSHAVGIGFYNPTGVDPEFAEKVDFSMLEVINEAQVLDALAEAKRANLQLTLNIGPVITESLPVDQVNISYVADDEKRTKRFLPRPKHKLKRFVSDDKIARVVERLALAMRAYPGVIDPARDQLLTHA